MRKELHLIIAEVAIGGTRLLGRHCCAETAGGVCSLREHHEWQRPRRSRAPAAAGHPSSDEPCAAGNEPMKPAGQIHTKSMHHQEPTAHQTTRLCPPPLGAEHSANRPSRHLAMGKALHAWPQHKSRCDWNEGSIPLTTPRASVPTPTSRIKEGLCGRSARPGIRTTCQTHPGNTSGTTMG